MKQVTVLMWASAHHVKAAEEESFSSLLDLATTCLNGLMLHQILVSRILAFSKSQSSKPQTGIASSISHCANRNVRVDVSTSLTVVAVNNFLDQNFWRSSNSDCRGVLLVRSTRKSHVWCWRSDLQGLNYFLPLASIYVCPSNHWQAPIA